MTDEQPIESAPMGRTASPGPLETLVLSPNLGCPLVVGLPELAAGRPLQILVAVQAAPGVEPLRRWFEGRLFLQPSYPEGGGDGEGDRIPLGLLDRPRELTDWSTLREIRDAEDTRRILPFELHRRVLGERTRYFELSVGPATREGGGPLAPEALAERLLGGTAGARRRLRLFDLLWRDEGSGQRRVNHHAVQVMARTDGELRLLHGTDLHVSRRNDQILDEVCKERNGRSRTDILRGFVNFNENARAFLRHANRLAERGELDAVVLSGDLVDFAHHGWRDDACLCEHNWQVFHDLVTGRGREAARGSEGLKVAVFTTLGNHDWRLHPYSITLGGYAKTFGLETKEAKHYPYEAFDARDLPAESARAKEAARLERAADDVFNLEMFTGSWKVTATRWLSHRLSVLGAWILGAFGVVGGGAYAFTTKVTHGVAVAVVAALFFGAHYAAKALLRKAVNAAVDNPLHASATALHPYFLNVSPYFDLAVTVGPHWLVLMDTGCDVFVGKLLDRKEAKELKRMSIEDNILGGSPDSRAFDSEQRYYAWSQIVWLEKVLQAAHAAGNGDGAGPGRVLLFMHAPPINTKVDNAKLLSDYSESARRDQGQPAWVAFEELNLTYGAAAHYLSQFFYLCLGTRESDLAPPGDGPAGPALAPVDLVLSGHAHRNVEFRVALEGEHVRLYTDRYSADLARAGQDGEAGGDGQAAWWAANRPVVVQTAAVGLKSDNDPDPPYRRFLRVDEAGVIRTFEVWDRTVS